MLILYYLAWGGPVEKVGNNALKAIQQPENLIFGSYQTNSLITRYVNSTFKDLKILTDIIRREKAYQNLFANEASIQRKIV